MGKNKGETPASGPLGSRQSRPHDPDGWDIERDAPDDMSSGRTPKGTDGFSVGDPNRGRRASDK